MATIPLGNFGQTVATPQRSVQVAQTGQTARALEQLGQTGTQIANQQMAAQTKLDQEAADRAAQTDAARVRTTKINQASDALDVLSEDIKTGKVPKDKAAEEWQHRSGEILRDATNGIDPRYAGAMQVEFDGLIQKGQSGVRHAVTLRNQDDTQANLLVLGEEYQRMAEKDRPRAMAEYFTQLDHMAPDAGWAPDQVAKIKQQFKEGTAYTQAFKMAKAASGSVKAIDQAMGALDGEQFSDLDPQKKAAIAAQLDAHKTNLIQRAEIAAQRADRQKEAALKRASAEFEAAQARVTAGIPDNPDQVGITTQALTGTPYLETYRALQQQARDVGGFAAQPITAQQAHVDALNAQIAQGGTSKALITQRDLLQKTLEASKKAIHDDPMRGAAERGVIDQMRPIDTSSIDGFTRSISGRLQQAQVVQTWAKSPVSPLTADEAANFKSMIARLPVQQRASAIASIGNILGPQASAGLAKQMGKEGDTMGLWMRFGTSSTSANRPVIELAMKGEQAIKEKTIKGWDTTEGDIRAAIAASIGDGSGFASDDARRAASDAAYYIAAGLTSEGRYNSSPTGFKSARDVEQAVTLAVGGKMIDHNGKRIPIPAGMDEGDFNKRIQSLTPQEFKSQAPGGVVVIGGNQVPLDAFVKSLPDANLVSIGKGSYNVVVGNRVVTTTDNKRIIVKAQ